RQTPNRRHRWLAPANSDLESSYESRPGYHTVEVHTQAGPTQVSLHNQAVEALVDLDIHNKGATSLFLDIVEKTLATQGDMSFAGIVAARNSGAGNISQELICKLGSSGHLLFMPATLASFSRVDSSFVTSFLRQVDAAI